MSRLRASLGREPEAGEIAADLGITLEQYDHMLDELRTIDLAVMRRAGSGETTSLVELAIDTDAGPYLQLERRELRRRLALALSELPERERQILALSYEHELTLAEIGQVIGVGESRVSQLRTQAVTRLRSLMREWTAPAEVA
jgi:RNA polymerase sigma factor for flagellar operon FliA